jgi:hypothetical protein
MAISEDEFYSKIGMAPEKTPEGYDAFLKALDVAANRREKMPAGEALKRGFGYEMSKAYAGVAPMFGGKGKSPEELAAEEAALSEHGGFPASAGRFAGEAVKMAPTMLIPGAGPASILGRVAGSAGLSAMMEPGDRTKAAMIGGAGALGGEAVGAGLSKLIRGPVAQPGVKESYEAGLRPSFAQAVGGGVKRFEETMESSPLIGPAITGQQLRSMKSFNTSTVGKILEDLNRDLPEAKQINVGEIPAGREGFLKAEQAAKEAYGKLTENTSGSMTPEFESGLQGIRDLSKSMRPEYRDQIDSIIKHSLESRFKPGERVDGVTIKEIDSELSNLASKYSNSAIADERRVGDAILETQSQLHNMMELQNPEYATQLRNADRAYFEIRQLGKAMTSSVKDELATPSQLLQALRAKDRTGFSRGKMPLQEYAETAQELVGNRYPDPGTAGRLQAKDVMAAGATGFIPGFAAAYAAKGLYEPAIQDFLVRQTFKEPGLMRLMAMDAAKRTSPALGAAGASSTLNR